jgi:hypothetical protein
MIWFQSTKTIVVDDNLKTVRISRVDLIYAIMARDMEEENYRRRRKQQQQSRQRQQKTDQDQDDMTNQGNNTNDKKESLVDDTTTTTTTTTTNNNKKEEEDRYSNSNSSTGSVPLFLSHLCTIVGNPNMMICSFLSDDLDAASTAANSPRSTNNDSADGTRQKQQQDQQAVPSTRIHHWRSSYGRCVRATDYYGGTDLTVNTSATSRKFPLD